MKCSALTFFLVGFFEKEKLNIFLLNNFKYFLKTAYLPSLICKDLFNNELICRFSKILNEL